MVSKPPPRGARDRAERFFKELLESPYTDVECGGFSLGFQQDPAEAPSGPLVIIEVDDLEATRRAVETAGGTVTVEPFDFPGGRRFHFREPGGNELAAWIPTDD